METARKLMISIHAHKQRHSHLHYFNGGQRHKVNLLYFLVIFEDSKQSQLSHFLFILFSWEGGTYTVKLFQFWVNFSFSIGSV